LTIRSPNAWPVPSAAAALIEGGSWIRALLSINGAPTFGSTPRPKSRTLGALGSTPVSLRAGALPASRARVRAPVPGTPVSVVLRRRQVGTPDGPEGCPSACDGAGDGLRRRGFRGRVAVFARGSVRRGRPNYFKARARRALRLTGLPVKEGLTCERDEHLPSTRHC
jgi:hypothetical protein